MSRTKEAVEDAIRCVIAEHVAPKIRLHKGGVELVDFNPENGIATVRFHGNCVGCPLSTMTLKMGVESELFKHIPEVEEVRADGIDEESLEFIGEE